MEQPVGGEINMKQSSYKCEAPNCENKVSDIRFQYCSKHYFTRSGKKIKLNEMYKKYGGKSLRHY